MLVDFKDRINVEAEYQRGSVWSRFQQALLIDSILRGFDIPKIYLRKRADGRSHLFDVIDGKQRLTAIWTFFADAYPLLKAEPFPGLGDLSGLRWSGLGPEARDRLQFATITVSTLQDASIDEIREVFLRLQRGEPLRAAEKRNAMHGPVRNFVADSLAEHPLWPATRIRSARFGWHEHAAIILSLVYHDGPTDLKGADLLGLYEMTDFDPTGPIATRTLCLLDVLHAVAIREPGFLRTRWGLVDLALVIMQLRKTGHTLCPHDLMSLYREFENRRRTVSNILSDLQRRAITDLADDNVLIDDAAPADQISEDELTYYLAFGREGATKENIAKRSGVMYHYFLTSLNTDTRSVST